ncbi:hypothetical protein EMPS_10735 [Entomortierella parvispora]|uniref:Uncharacterized protein n=1 Tax=Entomortierella parvispora TaxID=205924 RepID=A0A9P3HKM0_9FUNG|nr:hypothetical protein EMPS_10735 [Entomortierella parvispora]
MTLIQEENITNDLDDCQYFEWSAGGDVHGILAEMDPDSGKKVVYLSDIQEVFRGEFFIKNGIMVVPSLKDKSRKYDLNNHDIDSLEVSIESLGGVNRRLAGQLLTGISEIAHTVEEVRDIQQRNQEGLVDMMKTTHNWLALILERANSIFRLTYELHEYPIPRLFVVLPARNSFRDRINPLVDKYRLYFLCECDTSSSGDSNKSRPHIHFAKHDGYDIDRPSEFFQKYGPYILTLLQLLRYSVLAVGFVVSQIAGVGQGLQDGIEEIENATRKQLTQKVDEAIGFLKDMPSKDRINSAEDAEDETLEVEQIEALEGADLRHLASFLKNRDTTQVLGNLYRLARPNGTIKWVCLDHYRDEIRDLVSRGTPSTVLAKVMAGHELQSFTIRNCGEFLVQAEKLHITNQLRRIHLGTGIEGRSQVGLISSLVKKSPRLRHLTIQLPDLHAVRTLFANAKPYQFRGYSVLEVQLDTGENLTGCIQNHEFSSIHLVAMDCSKQMPILPFVTKMTTSVHSETDLHYLGQFSGKDSRLKEIDVEVAVAMFFDVYSTLLQKNKGIRTVYFHDKDNTLRMSDIRDPTTAEVDLLNDSVDFDRLFSIFGALPRNCGSNLVMTNEVVAILEERTQKESRLEGLWIDISLLDGRGIENAIAIIQRSNLKDLFIWNNDDLMLENPPSEATLG